MLEVKTQKKLINRFTGMYEGNNSLFPSTLQHLDVKCQSSFTWNCKPTNYMSDVYVSLRTDFKITLCEIVDSKYA